MRAETTIRELRRLGIPGGTKITVPDVAHALPDEDWIAGPFARAWSQWMLDANLRFQPEAEDCDDFARLCACFAELLHARTPARPRNTALAFGVVWYQRDAGGGHALNFFLTAFADQMALCFFEPQTARIVHLSATEIESISEVLL